MPLPFAALLSGCDYADSDSRTRDLCAAYFQVLANNIKSRLLREMPAMTPNPARRNVPSAPFRRPWIPSLGIWAVNVL